MQTQVVFSYTIVMNVLEELTSDQKVAGLFLGCS